MRSIFTVLFLAASADALVAHAPVLRTVTAAARAPLASNPTMLFGGAGRSMSRIVKRCTNVPKLPGFGKGAGGMGRGCDGGDGGAGTGDAVAPEPEDEDNAFSKVTSHPFTLKPVPLLLASGCLCVRPCPDTRALIFLHWQVWKAYEQQLEEKPLLMKALTSFVGFALGDILAQLFIQKNENFDYARLFRLASFGFLIHGTSSHWFYGMLDGKIPGTSAKVVATKVFIDQVLWNPIFGVMFFSYVALLEAKGLQYVVDKTRNGECPLTQAAGGLPRVAGGRCAPIATPRCICSTARSLPLLLCTFYPAV